MHCLETGETAFSYLRDNGDLWSQVMQTNLGDVDSINDDASPSSFYDPKQRKGQGGFTCPCSTHNTNLSIQAYHPLNLSLSESIQNLQQYFASLSSVSTGYMHKRKCSHSNFLLCFVSNTCKWYNQYTWRSRTFTYPVWREPCAFQNPSSTNVCLPYTHGAYLFPWSDFTINPFQYQV